MNTIKNEHWFIHNNELAISLMHFYAEISMVNGNNVIYFVLKVVNTNKDAKELSFMFLTLEEAIVFTEEVVSNCWTFDDIINSFNFYQDNQSKMLKKENNDGSKKRLQ